MPDTYTPEEAAHTIGMAASTVRLWCKTYAVALSDGANPSPGNERRLTAHDVATLQQVKRWRDERIAPNEIITLLQAATRRNEVAPLTIDATPTPNAQEARSDDLLLPMALSSLQAQMDALRADFRALQANQQRTLDAERQWGRIQGAIAALVAASAFVWLLYALG